MTRESLPISFLSDFGLVDEFVGVVHGVLAKLAPDSRVIDVGHGTPRGDVRAAALAMTRAIQYLPEGVALVVVDPGVGSERKSLAVQTDWGYFVGPDNGVLSPAVAMVGGASLMVSIENPEVRIPSPGETFHGRDLFGPAAALLASGEAAIRDLGPELAPDQVQPLLLPLPETEGNVVTGEAWWVDRFGNVETNIGPDDLRAVGLAPGAVLTVRVGASVHSIPWAGAYSDVEPGELLIHVDSAGLIAIAVRDGSADQSLNLSSGVSVTLVGTGGREAG
jgi:S-adenosylmethionine hydrolase